MSWSLTSLFKFEFQGPNSVNTGTIFSVADDKLFLCFSVYVFWPTTNDNDEVNYNVDAGQEFNFKHTRTMKADFKGCKHLNLKGTIRSAHVDTQLFSIVLIPVGWGCRILRLHLCRVVIPFRRQRVSWYDTKPSQPTRLGL